MKSLFPVVGLVVIKVMGIVSRAILPAFWRCLRVCGHTFVLGVVILVGERREDRLFGFLQRDRTTRGDRDNKGVMDATTFSLRLALVSSASSERKVTRARPMRKWEGEPNVYGQ